MSDDADDEIKTEPSPEPDQDQDQDPEPEPIPISPNFLSDIRDMLLDAIPGCEICENTPELIRNMILILMNDIIKRTNRRRSKITEESIQDVIENTPEYQFLMKDITK